MRSRELIFFDQNGASLIMMMPLHAAMAAYVTARRHRPLRQHAVDPQRAGPGAAAPR